MGKVKSFVKQVLAQLTGDQAKVIAEYNYRTAKAAVKGQMASLEHQQIMQELAVEEAKDALKRAKYPTERITNAETYLSGIKLAKNKLAQAQEHLDNIKYSLEHNEELQKEFDAEEE